MKNFITLLLISLSLTGFAQDQLQNKTLSPEELKEDFLFYRDILENTHPGLYRYSSKSEMQSRLDSVAVLLDREMSFYDFYRIIASVNASIKCAHSFVIPNENFEAYMMQKAKGIPFYMYPTEDRLIVLFNGSDNESIRPGFELTAVNGQSMRELRKEMTNLFWEDGNNVSGRMRVLEGPFFTTFYYSLIDQPDQFVLTFKDESGKEHTIKTRAKTFAETQKSFKKNPVNKQVLKVFKNTKDKNWNFKILKDVDNTAYLRFNGFGDPKAVSNESSAKLMKDFMLTVMEQIEAKNIENLILDIRDNGGGWDAMGIELYKFLSNTDRSFEFYGEGFAVTNDTAYLKYSDLNAVDIASLDKELIPREDGTFLINPEFDQSITDLKPYPERFKGKLYILINRGTGSAASEFAAIAKSNQIGVIVGEESSGVYEGVNGTSFLKFELPHSKMYLRTPLVSGTLAVKPVAETGRGVMPDVEVLFRREDLIIRNDRPLKYVKQLIRESGE